MEGLVWLGYTGINPRSKVRFSLDGIKPTSSTQWKRASCPMLSGKMTLMHVSRFNKIIFANPRKARPTQRSTFRNWRLGSVSSTRLKIGTTPRTSRASIWSNAIPLVPRIARLKAARVNQRTERPSLRTWRQSIARSSNWPSRWEKRPSAMMRLHIQPILTRPPRWSPSLVQIVWTRRSPAKRRPQSPRRSGTAHVRHLWPCYARSVRWTS